MKNHKTVKLIRKLYSIHPTHQTMIENFIEKKGMTSESDVIRQAIVFMHEKSFPDYVFRESAAGEEKKKRREEEDEWESMSDEEYARNILKVPIYETESGPRFILMHTIGNGVMEYQLDGLKDRMIKSEDLVEFHLETLKKFTVEERTSDNTKRSLRVERGMII